MKDKSWNPYGLNNAVLLGKLVEAEEKIKGLVADIDKLKQQNNNLYKSVNMKERALEEYDKMQKLHMKEISKKQQDRMARKDREWKESQDKKEEEWLQQNQKHEDRMAVVEMALEDYGLKMKWMEKGLHLSDLLFAEDDVSIEDDDMSWDEIEE